jgi:ketosteroid isomerase-like protein
MKKIFHLLVIFLVFSTLANAQSKQENEVAAAVEMFKKAILDADKNLLSFIAADELVYGHSSGKVENKTEFMAQILDTQTMDYTSIDMLDQTIQVAGKVAVVRHIYSAQTIGNGKPGNVKIGNMLIWQKQHGKWKLLARQAYKL